jgi:Toprim domain
MTRAPVTRRAERAPTRTARITGRSPIALAPPNDLLGLAICEGIEDALSVHAATGLGTWASGGAGRMPTLTEAVPSYVECVNIFGHEDPAGRRYATDLAVRLRSRGFEVLLKFLGAGSAP